MSSLLPLRTVTARAALALALVVPAASVAIAQQNTAALQQMYHTGQNDDFGAQHDLSISAARSVWAEAPTPAERRSRASISAARKTPSRPASPGPR